MLGDVEETVYVVDDESEEDDVKTVHKKSEMLFVRGEPVAGSMATNFLTNHSRRQCCVDIPAVSVMIMSHSSEGHIR